MSRPRDPGAKRAGTGSRWIAAVGLLLAAPLAEAAPDLTSIGDVLHPYVAQPPVFCDQELGCAKSFGVAIEIPVRDSGGTGLLAPIGRRAKAALFSGYPPFLFRVVFASAETRVNGESAFADPRSHWYDIFFGYYEIEVARSAWTRPFGFENSTSAQVHFEDIVRLGKADWNYFSNHLYGVPAGVVSPFDVVDMSKVKARQLPRKQIGGRLWDVIDIGGVEVVSPYQVASDKRLELVDPLLTPIWRLIFGTHPPVAGFPTSFFGESMRAKGYLCFNDSHPDRYTTLIFGGTIRENFPDVAKNERFLKLQLEALERIMLNPATKSCAAPFLGLTSDR